jgi:HEAT repeat protein
MDIIKGFGSDALEEASKRLENLTPLKSLRLLAFFREVENHSAIPLLKELYKFFDLEVRKEILEILFMFKDSEAIDLLRKSILSSNREEVLQAVSMTFRFDVIELIGDLMSLLKTFYIREEDAILNEWIVRCFGNTGHSWAVPYMEKIMEVRLTLSPQRLSQMKEIFYGCLENFPRQTVQSLLERGSKSWNRKIRAICLSLIEQKEL